MPILEDIKRIAEKVTGIGRPPRSKLDRLVCLSPPKLYRFRDDGRIPNNAELPLVLHHGAVRLDRGSDPAAVLEETFASRPASWDSKASSRSGSTGPTLPATAGSGSNPNA